MSLPMSANAIRDLASVIIPCWNQLQFTRQCLPALLRLTRRPWELILVNNGSTDGTAEYLAGVQDAAAVPLTVIANERNRGFPAAINQGLQLARGEFLVLLNNDVVVTDGWLDQLVALTAAKTPAEAGEAREFTTKGAKSANGAEETEDGKREGGPMRAAQESVYAGRNVTVTDVASVARTEPIEVEKITNAASQRNRVTGTIGLAGPMSNYAAPPQLVEAVPYHDLQEMHAFARRWRDEHRGQWFTVPKLSGFCLLLTRAVYSRIGGLDERFGLGLFDDDDLAERARRAGFELAVAHDLFVHHFGSRTFAGNGIDAGKLLDENARRFADKWGLPITNGRRVALTPFVGDQPNRETSPRRRTAAAPAGRVAKTSLTMIVRDEQENLPRALQSVRGLFDEIVVVDTGSADRTIEIARSFGAKVSEFAWIDDFGAARNAALAQATGDYAFWLDADDLMETRERAKLEVLLGRLRTGDEARAYVVRCACDPGPDGTGGDTVVDHIRLFPLRADVRWTYRVHEQILPALRRAKVPVEWTDVTVRHTGYADQALRARKLDRDTRILQEELAERPDDPFVLFNLGSIAVEREDWTNALGFLQRSLARSAPTDSITRKLFALIARVHQMTGDTAAALRTCAEGLQLDPEDAELWFRKAVVHRHRGEPAEAEQSWRRILTLRRPEKFASMDQGIYGHLTRRNLAALARERGDVEEARRLWRAVLAECPGDREALERIG
jgi:glycosyltransferase involved in cell wall biosynthesis